MPKKKKKCGDCKHWYSYASIYFDELEPYDCGECHVNSTYPIPSEKCGLSSDSKCCEKWEK
jgi:hypothetical protein